MKTLSNHALLRAFPPTKSIIFQSQFRRSSGWLTNGFFAIRENLEPKSSKDYRFVESDVNISRILSDLEKKIASRDTVFYESAEILNQLEVSFDKTFLVKLKSANFTGWCNPRLLAYALQGCYFFKDLKIMIGQNTTDPIAIVDDGNQILAMVMGFRHEEE